MARSIGFLVRRRLVFAGIQNQVSRPRVEQELRLAVADLDVVEEPVQNLAKFVLADAGLAFAHGVQRTHGLEAGFFAAAGDFKRAWRRGRGVHETAQRVAAAYEQDACEFRHRC